MTHGYTAVAGVGCNGCSNDPPKVLYNAAASSTYGAPLAGAQNITFKVNGRTCTGEKASENCAFLQQSKNGTEWWRYEGQQIVVASSGSSDGVFGTSAGLAGLGYSAVSNGSDSIIGKYLSMETNPDERWTFAMGLYGIGSTSAANGAELKGDSSGGYLHLNNPDPSFYTGSIQTMPVAGSDTAVNWGAAPDQVGSYDWTVQSQGWVLKTKNNQGEVTVTGGQGMWATMEAGYPYILLPQADASKIYTAIAGSQTYIVPTGALGANGVPVYDDNLAFSWSVPCTTTDVAIYMNFNGTSIPIQPTDLWTNVGGVCVGNIKGWADPTRTTAIMGSAFFRNAYVVFTAGRDSNQNTVGIAARPSGAKESKNTKVIIGAVVGGVAFLALLGFGIFFLARYFKSRRMPPSAEFAPSGVDQTTMGSRTMTALSLDRDKSPGPMSRSSFFGSMLSHGKPESNQNYIAEPWVPPPSSSPVPNGDGSVGGQHIMIQPWTPKEASEQAFLSPTGTAASLPYQPQSQSPAPYGPGTPVSPHAQSMSGHSRASAPTPPIQQHQRPMSQVSWVSATSQQPPQSAVSGHFTPPPPPSTTSSSIMQVHPPGTYVPTGPGAIRPLPTVPGSTRNSAAM
ncbi:hypothetical protein M407DRAFT_157504 [Tulasnella calospora MUT 4182]|uniref:Peptidase A1 domain-containing protein n=1 Tax=Tulasnella calospora MUT 4182 TaxID=1051891 RepID=A0A0C3Q600_9AGAM|nr:hypothetical protein M407DRAFT_157504 [Tulasnella calospora MUT 4182]